MTENELKREATFEEEYEILQKEKEELFAMENCDSEPPFANCVVRRASRCIRKLLEEIQQYRSIGTIEEFKAFRSGDFTEDLLNIGYTKGYNKAIDELAERLISAFCYEPPIPNKWGVGNVYVDDSIKEIINEVAEKMKEGA